MICTMSEYAWIAAQFRAEMHILTGKMLVAVVVAVVVGCTEKQE